MRTLRRPTVHRAAGSAAKKRPDLRLVERALLTRDVHVFDKWGTRIATYSVCLDHGSNEEFEEVALILAEQSGAVETVEFVHLTARCAA